MSELIVIKKDKKRDSYVSDLSCAALNVDVYGCPRTLMSIKLAMSSMTQSRN
ncbi:hypothetical protein HC248_00841 [Polaromonas vacuolata]|uniref:Uncharacterized protein n=1 Tax=Polaromonas vacuolata TaxID=37448 RepID=A0A6H2H6U6_9BURK|nr:hypothetical protein HC248_00841 [Polaromonas vacuolata]